MNQEFDNAADGYKYNYYNDFCKSKKTAVQWLEIELEKYLNDRIHMPTYLFEQAKQMEKEQMQNACNEGASDATDNLWGLL